MAFDAQIADVFAAHFASSAKGVHTFLAAINKGEINTWPIIHQLWRQKIPVAAPVVHGESLRHVLFTPATTLETSPWGIPEPVTGIPANLTSFNQVLIPMLCCDETGHRVGYGKGFYDRFLSQYPHLDRIGLCYFDPVARIDDTEPTDQVLDWLITPEGLYRFDLRQH